MEIELVSIFPGLITSFVYVLFIFFFWKLVPQIAYIIYLSFDNNLITSSYGHTWPSL